MEILYEKPIGVFQFVVFDASVKELHSASSLITSHAVERGIDITDHSRREPERLSVDVHVTNHPVFSPNADGAIGATAPLLVQGTARDLARGAQIRGGFGSYQVETALHVDRPYALGATTLQFPAPFDRVRAVHEKLLELKDDALPLTVLTSLRQYDEMLLSEITAPRDVRNGNAAMFSLVLVGIRTATARIVDIPIPLESRAERRVPRGDQAPADVEDKFANQPGPRQSIADRLARSVGL